MSKRGQSWEWKIRVDKHTKTENKTRPTNGCNSVVLALGEDHHSLPVFVLLGEVLGHLCNLCNVICL